VDMLIGVTSDTHDNGRPILRSVEVFNEKKVDLVIHCGDWDMPFNLRFYKELRCPIKAVLGNGDPDITKFWWTIEKANIGLDLELDAHFLDLKLDNRRIAVFHGDSQPLLDFLIETQMFDAIFFGHDHKPCIGRKARTLLVNPGSLIGVFLPEYTTYPYTIALYDTKTNDAVLIEI
jgi:putative phosphoesterase